MKIFQNICLSRWIFKVFEFGKYEKAFCVSESIYNVTKQKL